MSLGSRWKNFRRISLLIAALLCAALATHAQSSSAQNDSDDSNEPASLNFTVIFAEDGTAQVGFYVFGIQGSAPEIKSVLESSLGCTLQDTTHFRSNALSYAGSCHPTFTRNEMTREFHIATAPLKKFAQEHQIEQLTLTARMPDVEVTETQPALKTTSLSVGRFSKKLQRMADLNRVYSWKIDSPIPDVITVRFGFASKSFTRASAILLAVLLFPALLIYWMGRKALSSQAPDKAVVWFTYMRYLQWTLNFALVGWWIAADSRHLNAVLKFLSAGTRFAPAWNFAVTPVLIDWVPPILMWILCFVLSHPVQEKLRRLSWTRGELALQAFYSCCASLVPVAMFLTGLTSLATSSARVAILWFVGAFVVRMVAARAQAKFLGMQPQALTTGDLRDRAFGMAQHLGVKLQQIYIIPSGKGQMANAFARTGNVVSFTDFLLQRMTRREVDYVLGHELSHLKLGHPGKLALASVVSYFGAITAVGFAEPFFHFSTIVRYAIIIGIVTLAPYFCSRRFEYAADAGSVALTGDPQAAISALFKLAQLNMLPIHWSNWSEKWLTHPSSLRRAQAIAKKAGIPAEQVEQIAQSAAALSDSFYVLPSTVSPGSKVHSTQNKQTGTLLATYAMLAAIIFTPAAFALTAAHSTLDLRIRGALYLVGFVATIGVYYLSANFVPPMRLRNLADSLKTKISKEGILVEAWDGIPVGLSPAAAPRSYEANTNWDLGCLFIRTDRICYWGEETKFALRCDQITAIKLAPGMPGLLPPWRIYVAWKDDERGTSGVFNIGCINGGSTLELRKQSSKLAERLNLWWKTSAATRPMPAPLMDLTSPSIGVVTGGIPGKTAQSGKLFLELFVVGLFAIVGAVLCGLPFHLLAYLASSANSAFAKLNNFHSPGAGWYVVAAAVVVRFISMIPVMRYKDQAVVTLAPSRPRASGSSSTSQSEPAKQERDAVLTR